MPKVRREMRKYDRRTREGRRERMRHTLALLKDEVNRCLLSVISEINILETRIRKGKV